MAAPQKIAALSARVALNTAVFTFASGLFTFAAIVNGFSAISTAETQPWFCHSPLFDYSLVLKAAARFTNR
jgi:hypothetical protein